MVKYLGIIYKHGQYQLSTLSFKAPVCSSLASQILSYIKLVTTSVPYVIDKKQNNSVLGSKNSIQNNLIITNNDDMHYCETAKKISIPITSTPNHHAKIIATISASMLNLHKTMILPPVGK